MLLSVDYLTSYPVFDKKKKTSCATYLNMEDLNSEPRDIRNRLICLQNLNLRARRVVFERKQLCADK